MSYIDNSHLFNHLPERFVFSTSTKIIIAALSFGLGVISVFAVTVYLKNKELKKDISQLKIAAENLGSRDQENRAG